MVQPYKSNDCVTSCARFLRRQIVNYFYILVDNLPQILYTSVRKCRKGSHVMKNHISATESRHKTRLLSAAGLMTAALCITAPFSIPLPFSPVPLTLANLVIFISVYTLGTKIGTLSVLLYLALGAAGLPVFSGFGGGLGKLAGPTGGYLAGFLFLSLIQGYVTEHWPGKRTCAVTGMFLGMCVCYAFGTAWLSWQTGQPFTASLAIGVLPYLPGDALKIAAAAITGPRLRAAVRQCS